MNPLWSLEAPPHLLVMTGAGLSAESGVPTFRGQGGLWENHSIQEVCNIRTWKANFDLVHGFYDSLRARLPSVQPNAAHAEIAAWAARWPTTLLTANVDDLQERAGCAPVHLHGTLTEMLCTSCGHPFFIGYAPFLPNDRRCPRCSSRRDVKPAVIFFGETAIHYTMMQEALVAMRPQDALVVIGTSGTVIPIGMWAQGLPGLRVLANLDPSDALPEWAFDKVLYAPATRALPQVTALLDAHLGQPV